MLVNADFSRPATVTPDEYRWVASPQAGVERVMLDRVGAEKARATSIVRYAPGSRFPRHRHPGGEEILVLEGTFSDEGADFPAGWYVRNPPGSYHSPASAPGAVIFVKLGQMAASEAEATRIDTRDRGRWQAAGDRAVCPLFADEGEQVSLQRLAAGATVFPMAVPGAELLVLEGTLFAGARTCPQGTWLRLPEGTWPGIVAGGQGATFYLKLGRPGRMAGEL
ncbi:cupin domain-containing protein [Massilia sp. METH4]|uniref:cupin domain-containing protein n=1 Tax=Massilia sp. METH4 TaxID=3123041 RepID=UPI0030D355C6